jgi:hypothetical protein
LGVEQDGEHLSNIPQEVLVDALVPYDVSLQLGKLELLGVLV